MQRPLFANQYFEDMKKLMNTIQYWDTIETFFEWTTYYADQLEKDFTVPPHKERTYNEDALLTFIEMSNRTKQFAEELMANGIYYDFLSDLTEEIGACRKEFAQCFTPAGLALLSFELSFDEERAKAAIEEKGYFSILDPTCGTGRMLLAAAQKIYNLGYLPTSHMYMEGTDIDRKVADITYIQLCLYHIPAKVKYGDALTGECYKERMTLNHPTRTNKRKSLLLRPLKPRRKREKRKVGC